MRTRFRCQIIAQTRPSVERAPSPAYALNSTGMAKKKKPKRFRAVTAVKELARERIGTPPPTQVVPDRKKRKQEKHKLTLRKLLEET